VLLFIVITHLILTVGTGTAGKHSNLAAGLRRTLELINPEKFWLIPSTDEVSLGHELGDLYFQERDLLALIRVRNDLMHQLRAVTEAESQAAVQRVKNLLAPLQLPVSTSRPALF
jgi:hypothetical protein